MMSKLFTLSCACIIASAYALGENKPVARDDLDSTEEQTEAKDVCKAGLSLCGKLDKYDDEKDFYEQDIADMLKWVNFDITAMFNEDTPQEQKENMHVIQTGFTECFQTSSQETVGACCDTCEIDFVGGYHVERGYGEIEKTLNRYQACRVQYGCDTIYNDEKLCSTTGKAGDSDDHLNCMTAEVAHSIYFTGYCANLEPNNTKILSLDQFGNEMEIIVSYEVDRSDELIALRKSDECTVLGAVYPKDGEVNYAEGKISGTDYCTDDLSQSYSAQSKETMKYVSCECREALNVAKGAWRIKHREACVADMVAANPMTDEFAAMYNPANKPDGGGGGNTPTATAAQIAAAAKCTADNCATQAAECAADKGVCAEALKALKAPPAGTPLATCIAGDAFTKCLAGTAGGKNVTQIITTLQNPKCELKNACEAGSTTTGSLRKKSACCLEAEEIAADAVCLPKFCADQEKACRADTANVTGFWNDSSAPTCGAAFFQGQTAPINIYSGAGKYDENTYDAGFKFKGKSGLTPAGQDMWECIEAKPYADCMKDELVKLCYGYEPGFFQSYPSACVESGAATQFGSVVSLVAAVAAAMFN